MNDGPLLLIVTGHPATGKTTLARYLSRELGLPLLSKDSIKERLFDTLGGSGVEDSKRLGRAAIDVMFGLAEEWLKTGMSVVVESPLRPEFEDARIRRLERECGCTAAQIVLTGAPDVLMDRYRRRPASEGRHESHYDTKRFTEIKEMVSRPFMPLAVSGGTLSIDTSSWSNLEKRSVVDWVVEATGLRKASH